MTKRKSLEEQLAPAPAFVREAMLNTKETLKPGVGAVIGRFFDELKQRQEPFDNPSPAVFTAVAQSESTLATLLRALGEFAPQVSTVAGRDLRSTYYKARSGIQNVNATIQPNATTSNIPRVPPAKWSMDWRLMYPGFRTTRKLADSSKKRHISSINRCADLLPSTDADGKLNFYTGFCLTEGFLEAGIKHKTISGYLGGLVALGKYSDAPVIDLNGIRYLVQHHLDLADMQEKEKVPRIEDLMEKGGFDFVAETTGNLRNQAAAMPAHAARVEILRQTVALLVIHMNKPARSGDAAKWIIGQDLMRHPCGSWELNWQQGKTRVDTDAGILWDEVSEILDELILAGRPDRFIHLRYDELQGANWLTLSNKIPEDGMPSERIKNAIGIPSHDLRTLAADYLRLHNPKSAPKLIRAHLGHGTLEAGEEYRALCKSDVADREWKDIKKKIQSGQLAA